MRLFNWFRRKSLERELDHELQYHFDRRVADLSASGIAEPEARRRVAVELGIAQVREEVRDVWLGRWLRDFLYDLRFSTRSLLRSPGFTGATLASFALGIGATTAIYSLVDQVILHSLPVREPERLVLVDWKGPQLEPIGQTGRRSAIVNQAFVNRYLPGRNPLGVRIGSGTLAGTRTDIEIVGVVGDISYRTLREPSEEIWFSIFEGDDSMGTFYIRARGTPEQAFQTIRRIVHQADPQLPILAFRTVNEQVGRSLTTERLLAAISGSFGALALLLSLIGLYGVMSFVVTRRTREIGIRVALGATGASAMRLVLRDAVAMIAGGIAIALPCVAALGKLVQSQLFGVTATDPATVAAAAAVLAAGALAAAFIPAWRASNVSPADALRLE